VAATDLESVWIRTWLKVVAEAGFDGGAQVRVHEIPG